VTGVAVSPDTEARGGAGLRILALFTSIAVLAVGVPGALIFTVPDVGRSQGWVVTVIIAVWSGIRLSVLWVRGIPKLFDFFFWLFTYIFMGISATATIRANDLPYTTPGVTPVLDVPAALITLAGVVAYEIGAFVRWVARRRVQERELRDAAVSPVRAAVLYVAGLAVGAYYVSKMGLSVLFSTRTNASLAQSYAWPDSATFSIIYALAIYPMLVALGAFAQIWRELPKGSSGRYGYLVLMTIGTADLMLVANPLSSARYTFGTVAFALVMFAGAAINARRARLTMVGTIFAFLFVFPLLNVFRYSDSELTQRQSFFTEYIGNPDYDAFWQIANAYSYVVDGLVVPMRQLLGSLLFWVPRSLWSDKPTDTGILLANYRGYSFSNLSAPMWAELLVNGGVIAVIVGFFFIGIALASLDARMATAHEHGGWWGLVGSVLPVYTLILWRGSLLQATGALVVMTAGLFWVRKKSPPNSIGPTVQL
jgi:hypothetical protein